MINMHEANDTLVERALSVLYSLTFVSGISKMIFSYLLHSDQ